jgi:hypothetical protein
MASNDAGYELSDRKLSDGEVLQADEEDASLHEVRRSKSSASRDAQDRAELIRLGKIPVLKVRLLPSHLLSFIDTPALFSSD